MDGPVPPWAPRPAGMTTSPWRRGVMLGLLGAPGDQPARLRRQDDAAHGRRRGRRPAAVGPGGGGSTPGRHPARRGVRGRGGAGRAAGAHEGVVSRPAQTAEQADSSNGARQGAQPLPDQARGTTAHRRDRRRRRQFLLPAVVPVAASAPAMVPVGAAPRPAPEPLPRRSARSSPLLPPRLRSARRLPQHRPAAGTLAGPPSRSRTGQRSADSPAAARPSPRPVHRQPGRLPRRLASPRHRCRLRPASCPEGTLAPHGARGPLPELKLPPSLGHLGRRSLPEEHAKGSIPEERAAPAATPAERIRTTPGTGRGKGDRRGAEASEMRTPHARMCCGPRVATTK